ncbi:MAG TPA: fumarylacetoacetate hydrolase family protein [Anaerolineaceae bacterium]|nr:fumarylacetoacetate hydrolase family protein [Anaerolineaceae bacterium]
MRFVRYQVGQNAPAFGWLYEDRVGALEGSPFAEYRRLEAESPLSAVRLLAPVVPGKIICVGRNYVEHAKELDNPVPEIPLLFLKPPSAVIGPGQRIVLPPQSNQVDHEAELVAVIGRRGRWITPDRASQHVLGYTCGNDVTARDLQRRDGQWTRGKGFDTFCPLGPWIDTEFDPTDALITCRVNDEMRQMGSTREMVFSVAQLIAYASSIMTLEPGDIIMTGTPAGVGPLEAGNTVEVSIEGLGDLRNPVVSEEIERRV